MIPIRDQIPTRRVPFVNYILIAANIFVFVLQWMAGSNEEALIYQLALIPAAFTGGYKFRQYFRYLHQHVHACRAGTSGWQYVVFMDFWR